MKDDQIPNQVLLDEIRMNRVAIEASKDRERRYVTWANLFGVLTLLGMGVALVSL